MTVKVRAADDIPPRYEHKFLLTMGQARAIRDAIAPYCEMDAHSARSPSARYAVTSLYLDTPHLGFFRQWELGAPHRFKLRVRRYGDALGDSPVFFEIKERIEDTTIKKRVVVEPSSWLQRARDGHGVTALESDFCARRDRYRCQPTLLVRYEREAWRGIWDAYARVTFDAHLQFQVCDRWTLVGEKPWLPADDPTAVDEHTPRILLELKFERDIPRWLVGIMRMFELERRGFSKYGIGVQKTFDVAHRLDASTRESTIVKPF